MQTDGFLLHGFLFIHEAMRRDSARLAQAAARRPSCQGLRALGAWFARFRHQLEEHHHTEDRLFFPRLLQADATLAEGMASLDLDHQGMLELLDRVSRCLEASDGEGLIASSAALARLIDAHLTAEEALLVPATARCMTPDEQRAFEDSLRGEASLAEMGFALPWIASALPASERAVLLGTLPAPLRWMFRFVWSGRYERLASSLDVPAPPLVAAAAR